MDAAQRDLRGRHAEDDRDDEGDGNSQKDRIGCRQHRRRESGKGARHIDLLVVAVAVIPAAAGNLHQDRLRALTGAQLHLQHATSDGRHKADWYQHLHRQHRYDQPYGQSAMEERQGADHAHKRSVR